METSYGTAGPAFVARLQAKMAGDSGPGKLRARHGELTEMLRGGTDMPGRRVPLVACLALADPACAKARIPARPGPPWLRSRAARLFHLRPAADQRGWYSFQAVCRAVRVASAGIG